MLLFITALNLFAAIYGIVKLSQQGTIISLRGTETQNVQLLAVVFALVEATPRSPVCLVRRSSQPPHCLQP